MRWAPNVIRTCQLLNSCVLTVLFKGVTHFVWYHCLLERLAVLEQSVWFSYMINQTQLISLGISYTGLQIIGYLWLIWKIWYNILELLESQKNDIVYKSPKTKPPLVNNSWCYLIVTATQVWENFPYESFPSLSLMKFIETRIGAALFILTKVEGEC